MPKHRGPGGELLPSVSTCLKQLQCSPRKSCPCGRTDDTQLLPSSNFQLHLLDGDGAAVVLLAGSSFSPAPCDLSLSYVRNYSQTDPECLLRPR